MASGPGAGDDGVLGDNLWGEKEKKIKKNNHDNMGSR